MQSQSTPAVILRTRPLGEADLLAIVLTPEQGKLETAAARARNSKKRFAGGLSPGMRGVAAIARGRGALLRLESFDATAAHAPVGADLTRFAYVAYLCELTDELVLARHPDPELFAALCLALEQVIGGAPQALHLRQYELALLRCLGLSPALTSCCVCGSEVGGDGSAAFDGPRGGVLCLEHERGAPRLPTAALAAIQHLESGGEPADLASAPAALRRAVRDAIQSIVRSHLRRPLHAQAFFAALPRDAGAEGV
ncbi:DNA replication and repair protein RecO [Nannocystis exedens]|uniref:DNA repair protein RecO n=1 Tax=Nannocystis exedens TaxID=54 RepID=A0A1I2G4U5_9BACT|nr:DNA repair protein RecO [Nannocystis exedens]PCC67325.1 DNA repair protein RecO [Nannocystis exedens]SFF12129.1 DNA replication and repair protein RecO [Nannocystis exedens]